MPTVDPKYTVNLKGKLHPLYAGVLLAAGEAGLISLTTDLIQVPTAENGYLAIVRATATFADSRVFCDYGDASPENCAPLVARALIRMASTRAKGRVLRDAIGLGEALAEEIHDAADPPAPGCLASDSSAPATGCQECGLVLTAAQATLSRNKFGRDLCPACQRKL